ncbi:hypothetical protein B0H14DRAFT_3894700 [Mycena olivaceomarginata]|nr:hypothetical protein B0H14DRAFT_3894700 [Mycena olivaceomarginata]
MHSTPPQGFVTTGTQTRALSALATRRDGNWTRRRKVGRVLVVPGVQFARAMIPASTRAPIASPLHSAWSGPSPHAWPPRFPQHAAVRSGGLERGCGREARALTGATSYTIAPARRVHFIFLWIFLFLTSFSLLSNSRGIGPKTTAPFTYSAGYITRRAVEERAPIEPPTTLRYAAVCTISAAQRSAATCHVSAPCSAAQSPWRITVLCVRSIDREARLPPFLRSIRPRPPTSSRRGQCGWIPARGIATSNVEPSLDAPRPRPSTSAPHVIIAEVASAPLGNSGRLTVAVLHAWKSPSHRLRHMRQRDKCEASTGATSCATTPARRVHFIFVGIFVFSCFVLILTGSRAAAHRVRPHDLLRALRCSSTRLRLPPRRRRCTIAASAALDLGASCSCRWITAAATLSVHQRFYSVLSMLVRTHSLSARSRSPTALLVVRTPRLWHIHLLLPRSAPTMALPSAVALPDVAIERHAPLLVDRLQTKRCVSRCLRALAFRRRVPEYRTSYWRSTAYEHLASASVAGSRAPANSCSLLVSLTQTLVAPRIWRILRVPSPALQRTREAHVAAPHSRGPAQWQHIQARSLNGGFIVRDSPREASQFQSWTYFNFINSLLLCTFLYNKRSA